MFVLVTVLFALTRVSGPPTGVTRLGSPASPHIVPVDAEAAGTIEIQGLETTPKS